MGLGGMRGFGVESGYLDGDGEFDNGYCLSSTQCAAEPVI